MFLEANASQGRREGKEKRDQDQSQKSSCKPCPGYNKKSPVPVLAINPYEQGGPP